MELLAEQFKALGHPLRLKALDALAQSETSLTNLRLAELLDVDAGHLHFHVAMLEKVGLLEKQMGRGRERPYHVTDVGHRFHALIQQAETVSATTERSLF